ncbi:MAG: hypothetical protein IKA29_06500 [Clostridia bacterium]|nr:hypothetical protein [Clostridia bacterium]
MEFLYCILYLATAGVVIFLLGRIYPRSWFCENRFPYKSHKWESDGQVYRKIGIHKWKTKLPDASVIINKIVPGFMPKKRLDSTGKEKIQTLVKESCVAEFNHFLGAVSGIVCVRIWKKYGFIITIANAIWHVPFILIQRYNRPRLLKTLARMN